jgi:hypothetical protein
MAAGWSGARGGRESIGSDLNTGAASVEGREAIAGPCTRGASPAEAGAGFAATAAWPAGRSPSSRRSLAACPSWPAVFVCDAASIASCRFSGSGAGFGIRFPPGRSRRAGSLSSGEGTEGAASVMRGLAASGRVEVSATFRSRAKASGCCGSPCGSDVISSRGLGAGDAARMARRATGTVVRGSSKAVIRGSPRGVVRGSSKTVIRGSSNLLPGRGIISSLSLTKGRPGCASGAPPSSAPAGSGSGCARRPAAASSPLHAGDDVTCASSGNDKSAASGKGACGAVSRRHKPRGSTASAIAGGMPMEPIAIGFRRFAASSGTLASRRPRGVSAAIRGDAAVSPASPRSVATGADWPSGSVETVSAKAATKDAKTSPAAAATDRAGPEAGVAAVCGCRAEVGEASKPRKMQSRSHSQVYEDRADLPSKNRRQAWFRRISDNSVLVQLAYRSLLPYFPVWTWSCFSRRARLWIL